MKKVLCCNKLLILLLLTFSKIYPGLFSGYDKKTPDENVHDLSIEQINSPNDPYINYNLGVALYQIHKYEAAKNNFERAVNNAQNTKLKEFSYFNLANSCYKNALSCLPANWENESTKIEQDKLVGAIDNAKSAVKNYESLLELNKQHERAKTNLKKAKDLVEKLMKKQSQQKQDQNQKDQQEGDKDKSKKDQQKQQQKQEDQQDKSEDKSSEDEKKQNQSGDQQQNSQQQNRQQDESQKEPSGQEKEQDKAKSAEQKKSQQSKEASDQQLQAQQIQMQQASGQETQKESAEEKSMRLMLENLQSDEDVLQKLIMQRQTKDQKPLQSGQKPW